MGIVVLINDVSTDMEEQGLVVGNSNERANATGEEQAVKIAGFLSKKYTRMTKILASDAERVAKLVTHLRMKSKDKWLTGRPLVYTPELRERKMGVMTGTPYNFDSDLFRQSRVLAEKGESVRQCQERVVSYLSSAIGETDRAFVVTHPLVCQILSNVHMNRMHTALSSFWFAKGAVMEFNTRVTKSGNLSWEWKDAFNAILGCSYTKDEVYNGLPISEGH